MHRLLKGEITTLFYIATNHGNYIVLCVIPLIYYEQG